MKCSHVVGFLALSHGWTWSFWAVAALSADSIWETPASVFFYIGGLGVVLGGVLLTRVVYGVSGLRDLGHRLVDWRRVPPLWWLLILLWFPLLAVASAGVANWLGGVSAPLGLPGFTARGMDPLALLAMIGFVLVIGPLPEELGWRAFLQDRLQSTYSPLSASLFVGLMWWLWHLPLHVLPGYYDAFEAEAPSPLIQFLGLLVAAVLYAWVYNNTGRSVLAVVAFHFMDNFTGELLGIAEEVRPYRLGLMLALVVGIYLRWGALLKVEAPET